MNDDSLNNLAFLNHRYLPQNARNVFLNPIFCNGEVLFSLCFSCQDNMATFDGLLLLRLELAQLSNETAP